MILFLLFWAIVLGSWFGCGVLTLFLMWRNGEYIGDDEVRPYILLGPIMLIAHWLLGTKTDNNFDTKKIQ